MILWFFQNGSCFFRMTLISKNIFKKKIKKKNLKIFHIIPKWDQTLQAIWNTWRCFLNFSSSPNSEELILSKNFERHLFFLISCFPCLCLTHSHALALMHPHAHTHAHILLITNLSHRQSPKSKLSALHPQPVWELFDLICFLIN